MKKSVLYATIVAATADIVKQYKLSTEVNDALIAMHDAYLKPKMSGTAAVDIEQVVKRDKDNKVVEILCSKSGKWLPANAKTFYRQKNGKGIIGTDGESLHRTSLEGNAAFVAHKKLVAASKEAILSDLASGNLQATDIAALQKKLSTLVASTPDYSKVGMPVVESNESNDTNKPTKPAAATTKPTKPTKPIKPVGRD